MSQKKTKGFLIVASNFSKFYQLAINLGESVLDYYPDAKICLVTEERFLDGREKQFDQLILCDDHYRAKLWGMARTPYDVTMYLDADMECIHEDISTVFDHLEDHDMVFTPIDREAVKRKFLKFEYLSAKAREELDHFHMLKLNGGVCLYDMTKPLVSDFINDWQRIYYAQRNDYEWWPTNEDGEPDFETYPQELRFWDQFTLWWLTHKEEKYKDIDIGLFEDFRRWNMYANYPSDMQPDDAVLLHLSHLANKYETKVEGDLTSHA